MIKGDSMSSSVAMIPEPSSNTSDSVIRSYAELTAVLRSLPDPAPGYARVFRGQPKDHGKMLPTGLRGARPESEEILSIYVTALAEYQRSLPVANVGRWELDSWAIWARAINQHYGPGSNYLDVTRSLDVALWFALHTPERIHIGPGECIRYLPKLEDEGRLYIFDVPKWNGTGHPAHGSLIDLRKAPAHFASSKRIQVQQACLIYADSKVKGREGEGGELSTFCIFEAGLSVSRPMDDLPSLRMPPENLFPNPSDDHWYDFFLSTPLVWRLCPRTNTLTIGRPIPVTVYIYEDSTRTNDVWARIGALNPRFVYPWVLKDVAGETDEPAAEFWHGSRISEATRIVVEGQIMMATPPIEADVWNHEILATDIADSVEAVDASTQRDVRNISLQNVFVEFSPLEKIDWGQAWTAKEEHLLTRACWLLRRGNTFAIRIFYQYLPEGRFAVAGPLIIEFDERKSRFQYRIEPGAAPSDDFNELGPAAKPFLATLLLLRELSPAVKVAPFPMLLGKTTDSSWVISVPVGAQQARLLAVRDDRSQEDYYFAKDLDTLEPYCRPRHEQILETSTFESKVSWPQLTKEAFRTVIEAAEASSANQRSIAQRETIETVRRGLAGQLRSAFADGYAGTDAIKAFARSVIANMATTKGQVGRATHTGSEVSRALGDIAHLHGAHRDWKGMEHVVSIMELLVGHWPQNTEVAAHLANTLFNANELYCAGGQSSDIESSLTRLQALADKWQDNREVQLRLAMALVNTAEYCGNEKRWSDIETQIQAAAALVARNSTKPEIAMHCCKCVVNAVIAYAENDLPAEMERAFSTLSTLTGSFPADDEIQRHFAVAAFDVVNAAGTVRQWGMLKRALSELRERADRLPAYPDIQAELSKTAYHALHEYKNVQLWDDVKATFPILETVAQRYPRNSDLQRDLAGGIHQMVEMYCTLEDRENMQEALRKLKRLALDYPRILAIQQAWTAAEAAGSTL
jgi:hypothetical protein